jgi:mitochondrial enoyl-[acyl-carrier protein] reductase / trans-2-enoyl-CoA reductase
VQRSVLPTIEESLAIMKQVQFSTFGQPSVVARCVEVPEFDVPAAWEVIVAIEVFPINAADLAMLAGRYGTLPKLPATIGMEAVGRVTHCGSAVKNVAVGDRVMLLANNNWAEQRKVPATTVHKVPEDTDPLQLAMLKVNPATAHLLLSEFVSLGSGDWILQNAPLGSVGRCVIQLARQRGLRTINLVRDIQAKPAVLELGGDLVIELGPNLAQRVKGAVGCSPISLAVDAVSGPGTSQMAECLIDNGTIVTYGMLSGEPCVLTPEQVIFNNISLRGFWLSKILNRFNLEARTKMFDDLGQAMSKGQLQIAVDSCYSIEEIDRALRRAEQGNRRGKVLVTTRFLPGGQPGENNAVDA